MQQPVPVILFVYNRPEHTLQTLSALESNELAKETILYVFADGPKENAADHELRKIEATRKVLSSRRWCKEMIITEREKNAGLAENIMQGVTQVLDRHERAIVLEDDIVTSPAFLSFMNNALEMYRDNTEVACITGYIYPVKNLPETFFLKGADCWGWGTWKRAWKGFERNGKVLLDQLERKNLSSSFDFYNSFPYTDMLRDQIAGRNNSWAVRWYASCFLQDQLCLYPGKSYVKNIGMDGSGIHCETPHHLSNEELNKNGSLQKINLSENTAAKKMVAAYMKGAEPVKRSLIKRMVSKIIFRIKRMIGSAPATPAVQYGWSGNYQSWDEAKQQCEGYDSSIILDKVKDAITKVKNGEAVYERDSVLFYKYEYNWPLTAAMLRIAAEKNGTLSVIDFGGSLGSSYFQNRGFLRSVNKLRWTIVEQENFVSCGKNYFEDDVLHFSPTMKEAQHDADASAIIFSGVLPYIEDPYQLIREMTDLNIEYVFVDQMPFSMNNEERITVQRVDPSIYTASYPCRFMGYDNLLNAFGKKYSIVSEHDSHLKIELDGIAYQYKGFLLKRNDGDHT